MEEERLHKALAGLPVPELRFFASITSTNDEAMRWSEQGAPDGALVVADTQTSGRGRLNRTWYTLPGSALAVSLIVRPTPQEAAAGGLFSPAAALALSAALEHHPGLQTTVKWPNDVLIEGRKTAGILVESNWAGGILQAIVIGIGVNVAPSSVPPAGSLLFPATCVEEHTPQRVDRWQLLRGLLENLKKYRAMLAAGEVDTFLQHWQQRLAFMGQTVDLHHGDGRVQTGEVAGLSPDGGLVLILPDGSRAVISAGDVRLRPH